MNVLKIKRQFDEINKANQENLFIIAKYQYLNRKFEYNYET
jgi:hypothetical protein